MRDILTLASAQKSMLQRSSKAIVDGRYITIVIVPSTLTVVLKKKGLGG
jgi:cytidylate kinase